MPQWTPSNPDPRVLFSMEALRRAWQVIRRSGLTAGSDHITGEQFEAELPALLESLRSAIVGGTYRPHPVRRYYMKKASGKKRPIDVWALRDRVAQRVVLDFITPILEHKFLPCSYGFRPKITTDDAVAAVARFRDGGRQWVLDTDIQDCFGSIEPELLMAQVRRVIHSSIVKHLIALWLHTPLEGNRTSLTRLSQGAVLSPVLANLYLHRFDEMLLAALPQSKLVRFADDLIVLSRTLDEATWSLEVAQRSLANLRLTLNMRKTRLVHFDEGFQFLGYVFVGNTQRKL